MVVEQIPEKPVRCVVGNGRHIILFDHIANRKQTTRNQAQNQAAAKQ